MKSQNFMQEALKQAKKAFKMDEVPVGAVVIDSKTNKIVSKSYNRNLSDKDSTAHAEILAIKEACKIKNSSRLDDCDLYVTLEPCAMCAGAISLARIRRLYYGASDKKSGGVANGAKVFQSPSCHHKPEIYDNIHSQECTKLLKDFFQKKRHKNKSDQNKKHEIK